MKNDTERGPIGAWARRSRLAMGLSVEQVVERLSAMGAAVDVSYIRAIEGGSKRPREDSDVVEALAAVYRSRPAGAEPAPSAAPDLAALVSAQLEVAAALREQTTAIKALVERLDRDQEQRPEWVGNLVAGVLGGLRLSPMPGAGREPNVSGAPRPGQDDR